MMRISEETMQKLVELSAAVLSEYAATNKFNPSKQCDAPVVEQIDPRKVNRPNRYQSRDALYERRANFDTLFSLCFEVTDDRDAYITRIDIRSATDAATSMSLNARRIYEQEELSSCNSRGYRSWLAYLVARSAYVVQVGQSDVLYGLKVRPVWSDVKK